MLSLWTIFRNKSYFVFVVVDVQQQVNTLIMRNVFLNKPKRKNDSDREREREKKPKN